MSTRGAAAAPQFGVSLAVDDRVAATPAVAPLAGGEVRRLSFTGPACDRSVTARADPEDAVREASERDNVLTTRCPPRR